jgi:CPA2 family monovalent cation:H+ antiporter-2
MLILGSRFIPRLLVEVARTGSRELFTLGVLAIALGIAFGSSELFGVSLALGAFLAGVVISESDVSHQAASDALPMRDAFAVLFFVSVGMLFDPAALIDMPLQIAVVVAIVVLGKALAAFAIVTAFRYPPRVGFTVAAGLAQIGEFSFILVAVANDLELLPADGTNLVLAGALISITLNPLVFGAIDPIEGWLNRRPSLLGALTRHTPERDVHGGKQEGMRGHAVICGFGRVGSVVGETLGSRGFRYLVVERDRRVVEALRERGLAAIYGDAARPSILEHADLEGARLLVVTVPDPPAVRRIVAYAKEVKPNLDIIVRTTTEVERSYLNAHGVGEAVYGEWETALELTRRALHRFGVSSQEVRLTIQGLRRRGASGLD